MKITEKTARFFEKLRTVDGEAVTYTPTNGTPRTVDAIRDTVAVGATDAKGVALQRETMNWAFWRADLAGITPAMGDRITEKNGTAWEVIRGPNDRPWDLEEVDGVIMTVYTQAVKERREGSSNESESESSSEGSEESEGSRGESDY